MQALAVKFRPHCWDDVVEQGATVSILQNQLDTNEIKGAYCFVGAAGTGKTTCARIFANEINHGEGNPIEMDAASHNGVDDVREIQKMAQTKSMDSEYKVFIIDEAHMFSTGAWAAMLKLIEEPPAKSVFILCTTDYWKIPKTIQSRCQRFEFKRISTDGIYNRLDKILTEVMEDDAAHDADAIEFIAKQADGCMRDAITMLDKCIAFSNDITLDNVLSALGIVSYDTFIQLTDAWVKYSERDILAIINDVYADGMDLTQFIRQYNSFVLDVLKYFICDRSFEYTRLPNTKQMVADISLWNEDEIRALSHLLMTMETDMKYSQNPKSYVEAQFIVGGNR